MGFRYHKGKKDANHNEVQNMFTVHGFRTLDVSSLKCGFDFIAWKQGQVFIVEVKDGTKPPSATRLTDKEIETEKKYSGEYFVIFSVEQARQLCEYHKSCLENEKFNPHNHIG